MGLSLYQKQKIQSLIKPMCIVIFTVAILGVSMTTVINLKKNSNEVAEDIDTSSHFNNEDDSDKTSVTTFLSAEAASKVNTFNEKADIVNCYTGSYTAGQGVT